MKIPESEEKDTERIAREEAVHGKNSHTVILVSNHPFQAPPRPRLSSAIIYLQKTETPTIKTTRKYLQKTELQQ